MAQHIGNVLETCPTVDHLRSGGPPKRMGSHPWCRGQAGVDHSTPSQVTDRTRIRKGPERSPELQKDPPTWTARASVAEVADQGHANVLGERDEARAVCLTGTDAEPSLMPVGISEVQRSDFLGSQAQTGTQEDDGKVADVVGGGW